MPGERLGHAFAQISPAALVAGGQRAALPSGSLGSHSENSIRCQPGRQSARASGILEAGCRTAHPDLRSGPHEVTDGKTLAQLDLRELLGIKQIRPKCPPDSMDLARPAHQDMHQAVKFARRMPDRPATSCVHPLAGFRPSSNADPRSGDSCSAPSGDSGASRRSPRFSRRQFQSRQDTCLHLLEFARRPRCQSPAGCLPAFRRDPFERLKTFDSEQVALKGDPANAFQDFPGHFSKPSNFRSRRPPKCRVSSSLPPIARARPLCVSGTVRDICGCFSGYRSALRSTTIRSVWHPPCFLFSGSPSTDMMRCLSLNVPWIRQSP